MSIPKPAKNTTKKTAKKTAKKTVKKIKANLITVGDIPVSSSDYPVTPVSASSEKPAKPPIGTQGNPRKVSSMNIEYVNQDIPDGVSETYYIEVLHEPQGKKKPKWETQGYFSHKSEKGALKEATELRVGAIQDAQQDAEDNWRMDNIHNQKKVDLIQFRVTKATSKKQIEEHVAHIENMAKQLKDTPPVEMPDFSNIDPEYPQYRVCRRTFNVDTEVIGTPVTIKKGKK